MVGTGALLRLSHCRLRPSAAAPADTGERRQNLLCRGYPPIIVIVEITTTAAAASASSAAARARAATATSTAGGDAGSGAASSTSNYSGSHRSLPI